MDIKNIVAIDVHTHAEVSGQIPDDPMWQAMQEASAQYFKGDGPRPTIAEIAAYYRERKMACVIFPVDMESTTGLVRVPNEEVAEAAAENADVLIPFASIDPAKGKMGAREARRLIEQFGIRGFKFHPSMTLLANDTPHRMGIMPRPDLANEVPMPASQSWSDVSCHEAFASGRHRCVPG